MTPRLVVFGLGYCAARIAAAAQARGWEVISTGRAGTLQFGDAGAVRLAWADAAQVLSSVPPDGAGLDPVLETYGDALTGLPLSYLSSTGVYGDCGGAWADESAPLRGRRGGRNLADAAWRARGARVLRLPGIYGPAFLQHEGRSALDRVREGRAQRIDQPAQVFSRVHVDDVVSGALLAFDAPPGAYNLADDLPASQNAVIEEACRLLGTAPPPLLSLEQAQLSPMARAFYAENRRVANGKAKRVLGWTSHYPTYYDGLGALVTPA